MRLYGRHQDGNAREVIERLREAGATVAVLTATTSYDKGLPDLLVGFGGVTHLIEVKQPGQKRSEGQILWHLSWRGAAVFTVTCPEEALVAIGAWKPRRKP